MDIASWGCEEKWEKCEASLFDLVSVVIPVYNREGTIVQCLKSVLNQTYKNIEVLVIDDGSTDNSAMLVNGFNDKRIRLISYSDNKGANYARNCGIGMCKGKYIAFQDSDDIWAENKLESQINFMKEKGFEASFSPYYIIETQEIIPTNYKELSADCRKVKQKLTLGNVIGTPTLIVSRKVIGQVGVFDDEMPRLQDYEYVIRIVKKYEIGCFDKPLVYVTVSGERISGCERKLDQAFTMLLLKHYDFLNLEDSQLFNNIFTSQDHEVDDTVFKSFLYNPKISDMILKKGICVTREFSKKNSMKTKLLSEINMKRLIKQKFAIYGAGEKGKELYKKLKGKNLVPKFFIVSSGAELFNRIDGIKVINVDEVSEKNLLIIIAVMLDGQIPILETLLHRGFDNVITI